MALVAGCWMLDFDGFWQPELSTTPTWLKRPRIEQREERIIGEGKVLYYSVGSWLIQLSTEQTKVPKISHGVLARDEVSARQPGWNRSLFAYIITTAIFSRCIHPVRPSHQRSTPYPRPPVVPLRTRQNGFGVLVSAHRALLVQATASFELASRR